MLINKQEIVDILRSRGQDERADWVGRDLPDQCDTDRHSGLLQMLRIDPADLTSVHEPDPSI
jgi:hypothetical protein